MSRERNPANPDDAARIRKAEIKRKLRGIERTFRELHAYARNPTIDPYDERRVPTYVAR